MKLCKDTVRVINAIAARKPEVESFHVMQDENGDTIVHGLVGLKKKGVVTDFILIEERV